MSLASKNARVKAKSIHSLSTGALLLVLVIGCGGGISQAPGSGVGVALVAAPETTWVRPGETGPVAFVLTDASGAPVAGATVSFAIVDDPTTPGAEAQGATLAVASATTDTTGTASAQVTAGLVTVFRVRATSGDTEADAVVVVADGVLGSVDVAPFFPAGSRAALNATTIEVLFFDNSACRDIAPLDPPEPARGLRALPTAPGAAPPVTRYDFVSTAVSQAILGRARDGHGAILALGCVDLPGAALGQVSTVQIALALADVTPDPVGQFLATTNLAFPASAPLPAAAALAAPWQDLSDCPLDPAQLWVDATIAALPSSDAALAAALAARRGTLLPGPDGTATACRGGTDAAARVSIDALALGLFGSPLPAEVVALAGVRDDATHLLDAFALQSALDVRASGADGTFLVTHTLTGVAFGPADAPVVVALQPFGLPALVAATTATVSPAVGDTLVFAPHGFTLRLGTAARAGFGTLALAARGLPTDAADLLAAITGLAQAGAGTSDAVTGCGALDATLCAAAGAAGGCLQAACQAGLAALAARLDASFDAADGSGLDLMLSAGAAPLLDLHGSGTADRLGNLGSSPPVPATWTADLRAAAGRATTTALWEAVRSGN
jgi:hypothetical protein